MNVITEIPIKMIIPPSNERAIRKVGIEQLAESIKAVGLINALTVKSVGKNKYEIVAGRRRFWACQIAGITNINCVELDEEKHNQADVIEVTENLHRIQLTPTQEAEAIQKLRELKHSDESIAADLGMTRQFVARRAKLLDLSKNWKKTLSQPGDFKLDHYQQSAVHLWPVACLEMVARYPEQKQDELLQKLGMDGEMTVEDLKDIFGADESKLSAAIWDLNDATLCAAAGSCASCPKRAGAQPLLFSDDADPVIDLKKDTCLDKECWKQKHKAFIERKVREKSKELPNLVKISEGGARGHTLGLYQYQNTKKEDKGAVPALRVDGPKAGTITYVKIKKDRFTRSSGGSKNEEKKTPVQLAKEREERRWQIVLGEISEAIQHDVRGANKSKVMQLRGILGTGAIVERLTYALILFIISDDQSLSFKQAKMLLEKANSFTVDELLTKFWGRVCWQLGNQIDEWCFDKTERNETFKSDLQIYLDLAGVHFADLWAKALKEVPEPNITLEQSPIAKSIRSKRVQTSKKDSGYLANPKPKMIQDPRANEHGVYTPESAGEHFHHFKFQIPKFNNLKITMAIDVAEGSDGHFRYGHHYERQTPLGTGSGCAPSVAWKGFSSLESAQITAACELRRKLLDDEKDLKHDAPKVNRAAQFRKIESVLDKFLLAVSTPAPKLAKSKDNLKS